MNGKLQLIIEMLDQELTFIQRERPRAYLVLDLHVVFDFFIVPAAKRRDGLDIPRLTILFSVRGTLPIARLA